MADVTISGLPNANLPLVGTERMPMDQSGSTVDATVADLIGGLPDATTSAAGKMTAADKTRLDSAPTTGLAAGLAIALG